MPARRRPPTAETPLETVIDVCVRTGTNVESNIVGLLKLRLDTPIAELRSQLITLAGGIPKGVPCCRCWALVYALEYGVVKGVLGCGRPPRGRWSINSTKAEAVAGCDHKLG